LTAIPTVGAVIPMYADVTIAAIATPPGAGGVGIVRVSGALVTQIANAVFARSQQAERWASHYLYHGRIVDAAGEVLDEGLGVMMRAPRSYTGEDVLELHCHGSPIVLRRVLARVLACGARLAEPGEFTKRAFLNGRLDLAQAEAVIDLIRARTDAGATLAARQLCGRLSAHVDALRTQLIRLKALLETQIDFSEEDVDVGRDDLLAVVGTSIVSISSLLDTYVRGKLVRDGVRVAIIGKPNVGKSSLLNALLGEERAIVTPIPGTTRDTIEEVADFEGIPAVLWDTAGLRDPDRADPVERVGMQRTAAKVAEAQVLLTVLDASLPLDAEDRNALHAGTGAAQVIVLNKIDLPMRMSESDVRALTNGHPAVRVSAKDGLGLEQLRRCVVTQAASGAAAANGGPVITNVRHVDALTKAARSLELAKQSIHERRSPELVAVDVQDAIDHVDSITGTITSEDVLDRVFSEFCIGK
jgi:tRNA modification GTPase